MTTQKIKLTTLQKKAYIYLKQAREELGISDCNTITIDEAATVVDAKKMAIVASAIPTIGKPKSTTFKAFSSLIEIPRNKTFDLAVNFFKQEIKDDPKSPTNFDLLIRPLSKRFNNYWKAGVEDFDSLEKIYKKTKDFSSDLGDIKTIGAWSWNLFEKVSPVRAKSLRGKVNKKAFIKAISNRVPLKEGDYWVSGVKGYNPHKIYKSAKKGASNLWFTAQQIFAADDIYTDYKNESYANMVMRIVSTGLGYTKAPQLQALGSALGLTRWAVDEYSTVVGELIAKNFDQGKRTKAIPVDSWLVDAKICNKDDNKGDNKKVASEKEYDFEDGVQITPEDYNSKRIISPFINAALISSIPSTNAVTNSAFTLYSHEWKNQVLKDLESTDQSRRQIAFNWPSYEFTNVNGSFEMDNRFGQETIFTDGAWIYQFPDDVFNVLSDFKGAKSDDLIDFRLQMASRNSSGRLSLNTLPELMNLGEFNLFQSGELKTNRYEKISDTYYMVPFELTVTSPSDTRLGAEVNGKFYDLGKTETIAGRFAVLDPTVTWG